MTSLAYILLEQGKAGQGSLTQMIIMMSIMFAVFYFFMIRPQQKKKKEQAMFQSALKKGDEVITIDGIIGNVVKINDESIVIESAGSVRMNVLKAVVSKSHLKKENSTNEKIEDTVIDAEPETVIEDVENVENNDSAEETKKVNF